MSNTSGIPHRLLLAAVGFALFTKLGLFFWGALGYPFHKAPDETFLSIWSAWDSEHYLRIAEAGYSPEGISEDRFRFISHFPPGYPAVTGGAARIFGMSYLHAGLAVSLFSGLAAAYLLALLAWHEFKEPRTVLWTTVLFHLYPVSYFLITPYSESLYFLAVLGFFALLRFRPRYFAAGVTSAAAILVRLMGVNLVPVLALRIIADMRARQARAWNLLVLALPAAAVAGYLALNAISWGDPLYFLQHVYEDPNTPRHPNYPLRETIGTLRSVGKMIASGSYERKFMETLGWGGVLTAFALAVTLFGTARRLVPWEYSVYSLSYLLFYSSFDWGISNARYSYGAFPIFFVLARMRPRVLPWLLVLPFAAGLLYFSKRYVWGYWAF